MHFRSKRLLDQMPVANLAMTMMVTICIAPCSAMAKK
jgi:hypothetical protein